jgi:hypothetical protein
MSPNVAKILIKGALVELTGRVSTRAWTASNGELRSSLNFHTSTTKLYGGSKKIEHAQAIVKQEARRSLYKNLLMICHFNTNYLIIFLTFKILLSWHTI